MIEAQMGYAPAAGKLAAAIATISARRRWIRDGAMRSSKLIRRMVEFPLRNAGGGAQACGAQGK
jgi:hypothetical protein